MKTIGRNVASDGQADYTLVALHDCLTVWQDVPFELCWRRIIGSRNTISLWALIIQLQRISWPSPAELAACSNSPRCAGRKTDWQNSQRNRIRIGPLRTAAQDGVLRPIVDCRRSVL